MGGMLVNKKDSARSFCHKKSLMDLAQNLQCWKCNRGWNILRKALLWCNRNFFSRCIFTSRTALIHGKHRLCAGVKGIFYPCFWQGPSGSSKGELLFHLYRRSEVMALQGFLNRSKDRIHHCFFLLNF